MPSEKRGLPAPLDKLYGLLTKGLTATAPLWPDVQAGYAWVHQAAHLLTNDIHLPAEQVRHHYDAVLEQMRCFSSTSPPLSQMITTFFKVTTSYMPGLFHCYTVAALPRTNNALEQVFGSTRYHERRATGRNQASPGLVVRGAVRVVASVATQRYHFTEADLAPRDMNQWRTVRATVEFRHKARREQYRFRKQPQQYLLALEEEFVMRKMRS